MLQIKIKKETYPSDFWRILLQLNCFFAEINVQQSLLKENLKS